MGESWFAGLLLISCSGVVGSSPAGADSDPILGSAVRVGEEDSWSAPGLVVRSSSVEMVEEHSDPTVITDSGRSKKKDLEDPSVIIVIIIKTVQYFVTVDRTLEFIFLHKTVIWWRTGLLSLGDIALA